MSVSIKLLEDRVVVKPLEAEQTNRLRPGHPGHREGEAPGGRGRRRRRRSLRRQGRARPHDASRSATRSSSPSTAAPVLPRQRGVPGPRRARHPRDHRGLSHGQGDPVQRGRAARSSGAWTSLCHTVKVTLAQGPQRRPRQEVSPTITNDGVTIACEIELEDPYENLGAQLTAEVATKTTTWPATAPPPPPSSPRPSCTRVCATSPPARRPPPSSAASRRPSRRSPRSLGRPRSRSRARPRSRSVASVSSQGLRDRRPARRGLRTRSARTASSRWRSPPPPRWLDFTEGMQFDKGFISPHFVTDADRQEVVLEDAQGAAAPGQDPAADILPLLEKVVESGKLPFIIAEDVDGEALSTLVVNKIRGALQGRGRQGSRPATAARPCSRTSPCSPAPRSSRPTSAWTSRPSTPTCSATPAASSSPRTPPPSWAGPATPGCGRSRRADPCRDREHRLRPGSRGSSRSAAKPVGGVSVIKVGAHTEVEPRRRRCAHRGRGLRDARCHRGGIVAGGGSAIVQASSSCWSTTSA